MRTTRQQIREITDPNRFQELIEDLFQAEYGNDFRARDKVADFGIDGEIVSKRIFIQCYCPTKPEQRTTKRVLDEIKSHLKQLRRKPRKWWFITTFNLKGKIIDIEIPKLQREYGFKIVPHGDTFIANLLRKYPEVKEEYPNLFMLVDGMIAIGEETKRNTDRILEILAKKVQLPKHVEYSLRGRIAHYNGKYGKAIRLFRFGVKASAKENIVRKHEQYKATAFFNLGVTFQKKGDLESAFYAFEEALKIFKELKLLKRIIDCQNRIALVYRDIGKTNTSFYERGLDILNKVQELAKNLQYQYGMAETNHSIGLIYLSKDNFEVAFKYLNEALKIYEEIDDKIGIIDTNGSMAYLYYLQDNIEEGDKHFQIVLELSEKYNPDLLRKAIEYYIRALGHKKAGDLPNARKFFNKSLAIYTRLERISQVEEIKRLLVELQEKHV